MIGSYNSLPLQVLFILLQSSVYVLVSPLPRNTPAVADSHCDNEMQVVGLLLVSYAITRGALCCAAPRAKSMRSFPIAASVWRTWEGVRSPIAEHEAVQVEQEGVGGLKVPGGTLQLALKQLQLLDQSVFS